MGAALGALVSADIENPDAVLIALARANDFRIAPAMIQAVLARCDE